MDKYINTDILTQKEKLYLEHDESIITIPSLILRSVGGAFLILLSAFVTPSAEGKMPFSGFLLNTRNRLKYTRYRKAVINKLNGDSSEKNSRILKKINSECFALDDRADTQTEDKKIEEIYEQYLKENCSDDQSS